MRIDNNSTAVYGAGMFGDLQPRQAYERQTDGAGRSGDTVTFSNEARRALAAARAEAEAAKEAEAAEVKEKTPGAIAHEDFAAYMKEARGEVSSSDDDPITAMKKMIEKLEKKMESTARSDLPEETKQANIESLHQAIDALKKDLLSLTGPKV